jgi:hypothetical protein
VPDPRYSKVPDEVCVCGYNGDCENGSRRNESCTFYTLHIGPFRIFGIPGFEVKSEGSRNQGRMIKE